MKKLNFKKISVMALNEAEISMVKGGAECHADAAAGTRKVACCSCCKATKCNTKKSSLTEDAGLGD